MALASRLFLSSPQCRPDGQSIVIQSLLKEEGDNPSPRDRQSQRWSYRQTSQGFSDRVARMLDGYGLSQGAEPACDNGQGWTVDVRGPEPHPLRPRANGLDGSSLQPANPGDLRLTGA